MAALNSARSCSAASRPGVTRSICFFRTGSNGRLSFQPARRVTHWFRPRRAAATRRADRPLSSCPARLRNSAFVNVEADPAVSRVTTQLGMTVKRSYVARRITLLAVAAMAAVAATTVLLVTVQNQAPPPRHQLRVERTARQVSAAGASATAIAITPNGRTAYVGNYLGNSLTPITLATNKPGSPIKLGFKPWDLAITPNGRTALPSERDRLRNGSTKRRSLAQRGTDCITVR